MQVAGVRQILDIMTVQVTEKDTMVVVAVVVAGAGGTMTAAAGVEGTAEGIVEGTAEGIAEGMVEVVGSEVMVVDETVGKYCV